MTSLEPNASSAPAGPTATDRSIRQLWQVPTFLLGLTLLFGAWMKGRCHGHSCAALIGREIDTARKELQKQDGNPDTALHQLRKLLEQKDQAGDRLGEVHFLLGTAQLRLAIRAEAEQAPGLFQLARQELGETERLGVGLADQGPLRYRLARAAFGIGEDPPAAVAEQLKDSVDQAEERDKADAYAALTEAYLRLNPPDYKSALAANEKLRKDIALVPEEVLAPARLKGGWLLLKQGRHDEARKVLERVGPLAPRAVQVKARLLRAQSFQEQGCWQEAVTLWRTLLNDVRDIPELGRGHGQILYQIGVCHRKLGQNGDAITVWSECLRTAPVEESQAAAVELADLYLQESNYQLAGQRLAVAVRDVPTPGDWKNSLVELARLREICERACLLARQTANFGLAEGLAGSYERIADKGRILLLRAEILTDWGRYRRKAGQMLKDPDAQAREEDAARELFRQAGAAYEKAAAAASRPADRADLLWSAIACAREAADNGRVIELCMPFLEVNEGTERTGEGLYVLGEALRRENKIAEAAVAFTRCIGFQTPFQYRARCQLAQFALEELNPRLDAAEGMLEQNLRDMRQGPIADNEAREKTMFALGDVYFQKRNYRGVVRQLEEAVAAEQFKNNPDRPRARYQLAESYRQLAVAANASIEKKSYKDPEALQQLHKEYKEWMQRAADEFFRLAGDLEENPTAAASLLEEQRNLVPLHAADCRFNLGKYGEALELYDQLARRFTTTPEKLHALAGSVRCLSAMRQDDELRKRLQMIRELLPRLDEAQRKDWENWLRLAERPLQVPTQAQ